MTTEERTVIDESTETTPPNEAPPASRAAPKSKSLSERSREADAKKIAKLERNRDSSAAPKSIETPPAADLSKLYVRGGALLAVVWVIAVIVRHWVAWSAATVLTLASVFGVIWLRRYMQKTQRLGSILQNADSAEGRKAALARIDGEFKAGDSQAVIAKAQLQMQDNPRMALATLESVNLDKELGPVAGQIRAMRAMIHLTLGDVKEARTLVDKLDLGKQQEPKTRAMFAAVASEAWARTGTGQKAVDTLDLFNPEADDMADLRAQLWRSRAFAYAAVNDTRSLARAVKKLSEINPQLLGMFVGQKKVHPLLEREAKAVVMRLGVVPRKIVRQKR